LPFASRVAAASQLLLVFYLDTNKRTSWKAETVTYKPLVKEFIQIRIPDTDRSLLQQYKELGLLV
jgi:hypothetical protein